jgi:hypothetical protein
MDDERMQRELAALRARLRGGDDHDLTTRELDRLETDLRLALARLERVREAAVFGTTVRRQDEGGG